VGSLFFFVSVAGSGVALVVRPRATGLSRRRGGVSSCAGPLPVVVLGRQRGVGFYNDHERAADMVQLGESLHHDGGHDGGALGTSVSLLGHHGKALRSHRVELLG
jgi:hypothetical protein